MEHYFRIVVLFISLVLFSGGATCQPDIASRAPFVLELPEFSNQVYSRPIINIPDRHVSTFRVRVIEPFASAIDYGDVILTLNGEGINRGCSKRADDRGKIVDCEDSSRVMRGFSFQKGKNILEIQATSRKGHEYYASFLITIGGALKESGVEPAAATPPSRFTGRKFAIVIGVSQYRFEDAGLKSLEFADDDAIAFAEFLKSPMGGRFAAADIKLMLNGDASMIAIKSALAETQRLARADDLVVIFIAGHGAPDPLSPKNLYFLLYDTKVVDMEHTAFPMADLKTFLDTRLSAQRVLTFIDTCHSAGVNQNSKSLVSGRDLVRESDENNISNFFLAKQLFKENGRAILTSSDINEVSQESAKWNNHGVFTWSLLAGLAGGADSNADGMITIGELFRFTRSSVQKATDFRQNPIALGGSADNLVLATVPRKVSAQPRHSK